MLISSLFVMLLFFVCSGPLQPRKDSLNNRQPNKQGSPLGELVRISSYCCLPPSNSNFTSFLKLSGKPPTAKS